MTPMCHALVAANALSQGCRAFAATRACPVGVGPAGRKVASFLPKPTRGGVILDRKWVYKTAYTTSWGASRGEAVGCPRNFTACKHCCVFNLGVDNASGSTSLFGFDARLMDNGSNLLPWVSDDEVGAYPQPAGRGGSPQSKAHRNPWRSCDATRSFRP